MKKRWLIPLCTLLIVVLIGGSVFALAEATDLSVELGEIFEGDFFTTGEAGKNEGTITGDFIAIAQNISSTGEIGGDFLALGNTVKVSGDVKGNIRAAAVDINISSIVDRNVSIFGTSVALAENSSIKRNAKIYGNTITASGEVLGDISLSGQDITLSGVYNGDVIINASGEGTRVQIEPGTVISGKLTYMGDSTYAVPSGVQVGDFEYVQTYTTSNDLKLPAFSAWSAIKTIITMLIYFLLGFILYKLFPKFFIQSGEYIQQKPLSAAAIGIATLGSLVAGCLLLILIMFLSFLIFNASVFFVSGLLLTLVFTITVFLADLPVALWLGIVLYKKKLSPPASLASGLAIITVVKLALQFMKGIAAVSTLAGILSFIVNAVIWLLGTGAILYSINQIRKAANRDAENDGDHFDNVDSAESSYYY